MSQQLRHPEVVTHYQRAYSFPGIRLSHGPRADDSEKRGQTHTTPSDWTARPVRDDWIAEGAAPNAARSEISHGVHRHVSQSISVHVKIRRLKV